jgi:hypothetical protein
MITAITFLSITLFLSVIFLGILFTKNVELQNKLNETLSKMEKEKKNLDNLIEIEPGDSGIIPNYRLMSTDKNRTPVEICYSVTYEVEIIEVAKDKLKVRATDYTSTDRYPRDPKNRKSIIDFLQDKWVDKNSVELVMDVKKRRNIKLAELGI